MADVLDTVDHVMPASYKDAQRESKLIAKGGTMLVDQIVPDRRYEAAVLQRIIPQMSAEWSGWRWVSTTWTKAYRKAKPMQRANDGA